MGYDAYVTIYDADAIDKANLKDIFMTVIASAYEHIFMGKRIYTSFHDDNHDLYHNVYHYGASNSEANDDEDDEDDEDDYDKLFKPHILDTWEVCT